MNKKNMHELKIISNAKDIDFDSIPSQALEGIARTVLKMMREGRIPYEEKKSINNK